VADVNGDGKPDIFAVNYLAYLAVLLNTTAPGASVASFAPPQAFVSNGWGGAVMTADVNGDGSPDLIVANGYSGVANGYLPLAVLPNTTAPGATTASFADPQIISYSELGSVWGAAVADVNGDGLPDLIVTPYSVPQGATVEVLLNTTAPGAATPTFAIPQTFPLGDVGPGSVAVADVNGDGKPDMVVANTNQAGNTVSVLLNGVAPAPAAVYVNPAFTGPAGSDPDGAGPATALGYDAFATIQAALDVVAPGGTVNVAAGSYAGGLTLSKAVKLQGSGSASTFVTGTGTGTGTGLDITAPGATVSGLTVRGFASGLLASGGSYLALTDVGLSGNTYGGTVSGVTTFLFAGGAANETFYVRPNQLARQGDQPLAYSGVKNLPVDGGGGSDRLVVFLNDSNSADKVWLTGAGVARDGAPFLLWYRDSGGTFGGGMALVLGGGPQTAVVQGQSTGAPTTVYGGGGDDTFYVAMTPASAYANLTLDGGSGNSALAAFDLYGGASLQDQVSVIGEGEVVAAYPDGGLCTVAYQNFTQVLL
jgi:hypothetical protein